MGISGGRAGTVEAPETWPEYLRRIGGGSTQAQMAERIGIGRLSVCNWLHGKTQPKAETAITVARAYGRSPIEALIVARYLAADEAGHPIAIHVSLEDVSGEVLGTELARRLVALDGRRWPSPNSPPNSLNYPAHGSAAP